MFGFQPSSIPLLIKLMEAGYIILIPFVTMNRQALQTAAILYVCISYFALFLPIKVFVLFYLIKHRQGKQISTVSSYSFTALTLWFSGRLSSWSKEKLADPQTGEVAADCRESTGQFKRSVNQMSVARIRGVMTSHLCKNQFHNALVTEASVGWGLFSLLSDIISIHPPSAFPSGIIIVCKFLYSWSSKIPGATNTCSIVYFLKLFGWQRSDFDHSINLSPGRVRLRLRTEGSQKRRHR